MLWFIFGFFLGLMIAYFVFRIWVKIEVERMFLRKKEEMKKEILEKSRAVLKGKIAEQILPLLPEFDFNPADARFLGSPVDYVVFDGYTELKDGSGKKVDIVFVEVKKGRSELSKVEKAIRDAVKKKRVRWVELKLD